MITKEIAIYYKGQYYKNMRVFSLAYIPERWVRGEEEWYSKIKAFLMINYSKYNEELRIIDDNRLDNLLKNISNSKKNFIKFEINKEKIIEECPFSRKRKNSLKEEEEKKKKIEKKIEKEEIEKRKRKEEKIEKEEKQKIEKEEKKKKYYKDEKTIVYSKKERISKIYKENLFCKIYRMSEDEINKLGKTTGVGLAILNSLKYKVYKPSDRMKELVTKGIEEMIIKNGS